MSDIIMYSQLLELRNVDHERLTLIFHYLDKFCPNKLTDWEIGELLYNMYSLYKIEDGVLIYRYYKSLKIVVTEQKDSFDDYIDYRIKYGLVKKITNTDKNWKSIKSIANKWGRLNKAV